MHLSDHARTPAKRPRDPATPEGSDATPVSAAAIHAAAAPAAKRPRSAAPPRGGGGGDGGGGAPVTTPPKSAKRRAAEAALERRASATRLDALGSPTATSSGGALSPPAAAAAAAAVAVAACGCGAPGGAAGAWCDTPVRVPHVDWRAALAPSPAWDSPHPPPAARRDVSSGGGQPPPLVGADGVGTLPGGLRVRVVSRGAELAPALAALRAAAAAGDAVVGVDVEWRPDRAPGAAPSPVALLQLAAGGEAVLVRCTQLAAEARRRDAPAEGGRGRRSGPRAPLMALPAALAHFLGDPALTFVAFSWDSADEAKMARTFGAGRGLFSRLLDLQAVARTLGWPAGLGLAALAARVLGAPPPKRRALAMSDWGRPRLAPGQVRYAALDALVTGAVFRGLRLWHASPSPCGGCRRDLGAVLPQPALECSCGKTFSVLAGLASHAANLGHTARAHACDECGRVCARAGA